MIRDEEYRCAFEEFSQKAQHVQFLTEHPTGDQKAFEAALLELEKAHLAYKEARDAFVASLLPEDAAQPGHQQPTGSLQDIREDVPVIAELLWENAGRPTGTSEKDWQRAEAIVKRAVAASCGA